MTMVLSDIKELLTFCKENGIKSAKLGKDIEVTFFETPSNLQTPILPQSQELSEEDMLFYSAGGHIDLQIPKVP